MDELDAQVARKGPRADGRHAVAVTRWLVKWSYQTRSDGASCSLVKPSIETVAAFRYPTWDPAGAVEGTLERWREFMARVEEHEGHHRALAVKAGVSIRRALMSLPPSSGCSMLEDEASRTFHEVFDSYQAKQEAFDAAEGGSEY